MGLNLILNIIFVKVREAKDEEIPIIEPTVSNAINVEYKFQELQFYKSIRNWNVMVLDAPNIPSESQIKTEFEFATKNLIDYALQNQLKPVELQVHVRVGTVSRDGQFNDTLPLNCDIIVNGIRIKSGQNFMDRENLING